MRIGLLGGLSVEHDGSVVRLSGAMQLAVLFRLAVDAGTAVSYRAIAEDIWGMDAPENATAALQSIVSRLRSQLPTHVIESTVGGYRLEIARSEVDALVFTDLVAAAASASDGDAAGLAARALELWTGEPWIPSANFDWFERDLRRDRQTAVRLTGADGPGRTRAAGSGIPSPLTPLLGRERELESIAEQFHSARLHPVRRW